MVKVHVTYVPAAGESAVQVESFDCLEKVAAPSMPFWPLPLVNGDVVLLNMAMTRHVRVEKGKITVPGDGPTIKP